MTVPTALVPSAASTVLRLHADALDAPAAAPAYAAVLAGPAGSGVGRAMTLPGAAPHDLVVVEYGDRGYRRTWLLDERATDAVVYRLLGEGDGPAGSGRGRGLA